MCLHDVIKAIFVMKTKYSPRNSIYLTIYFLNDFKSYMAHRIALYIERKLNEEKKRIDPCKCQNDT